MRTTLLACSLAGAVALSGAAVAVPALSFAATGDPAATTQGAVSSLRSALQGLVGDGTLSSAQADRVATTLAATHPHGPGGHRGPGGRGPGGRGPGLAAAAEALGVTREELRTAAEAGRSLADLAREKGVAQDVLVDAMVKAEREHLAQAVAAGRLTQAEADARAAGAEQRITGRLDEPIRHKGGRHGRDGARPAPTSTPRA
jgi:hypothetical protein